MHRIISPLKDLNHEYETLQKISLDSLLLAFTIMTIQLLIVRPVIKVK